MPLRPVGGEKRTRLHAALGSPSPLLERSGKAASPVGCGGIPSTHPSEMKLDKKAPQDRFCNVMREVDAERPPDEQRLRVHTQAPVGSRSKVVGHSRPLWASHSSAAGASGCRSQIHLPCGSPSSQSSFSRREGKGGARCWGNPSRRGQSSAWNPARLRALHRPL